MGSLVAATLTHLKARPVLAGRNAQNLAAVGVQLGHGLDTAVVDVTDPDSVLEVLSSGDVVINTVGPFTRYARPIIEAAIQRRVTYFDTATEPAFISAMFEEFHPVAVQAGVSLVPGFGHEYVAGNLAASLALHGLGKEAVRIDIGYFTSGPRVGGVSVGTRASRTDAAVTPQFAWRGGQLVTTTLGDDSRTFSVDGSERVGLSIGGSEHLTIPRLHPAITDVGVYLGGPRSVRSARAVGAVARRAGSLPGMPPLARWVGSLPRTERGPGAEARAQTGTIVVATPFDAEGKRLRTVRLVGVNRYTFTAEILTWAALRAAKDGIDGEGTVGPVEAFGLSELRDACAGLAAAYYEPPSGVAPPR